MSILNDTMLETMSFNMTSAIESVTLYMEHIFSPGMNIGFVMLIVLSIFLHEHPTTPMMGVFVSYIGGLLWIYNISIFSILLSYWIQIVVYAIAYIIIGAAWTVPKWWIYVRKSKNIERLKADYDKILDKSARNSVITDEDRYNAALSIVGNNKYRFYTWMMWWPLNIVYTFASDPLTILYNWLYTKLINTFTNILLYAFDESPSTKSEDGKCRSPRRNTLKKTPNVSLNNEQLPQ